MEQSIFWLTIALLIIAGYYSLVFFPKQRAFRKHQSYVMSIRLGDEVITHGGLIGTVTEIDEEVGVAKIELAPGLEVRIIAAAILQVYDPAEIEANHKMALGQKAEEKPEA